ncbi:MAG TPA: hypothetical protein VM287_03845 [Egibacteraceae bacterium]|nr:hypothetical protein [Egibacteraceae bacterium]
MRVGIAGAVVAVLFAAVVVVQRVGAEPAELAVPPPGEGVADRLPDGTPVFVVREQTGEVVVVSPVSTHLDHLVVWCPAAHAFVEPVGGSLFDARGRWVTGPAPTGLAVYEASVDTERDVVSVGALGEPQPRWQRPDRRPADPGECVVSEGAHDSVEPALPRPVALGDLGEVVGSRVVVSGRLRLDGQGGAWLCPSGLPQCRGQAVQVASAWWGPWLSNMRGWADGRFLVRMDGPGRVSELVQLRTVEEPDYWKHLRGVSSTRFVEGTATVVDVDVSRWRLLVEDLQLPDGPRDSAGNGQVAMPMRQQPWPVQIVDERPPRVTDMYVLSPDEFATVVREDGPLEVGLTVDDEDHVVGVRIGEEMP